MKKMQPEGRRCVICDAVLPQYNKNEKCWHHIEKENGEIQCGRLNWKTPFSITGRFSQHTQLSEEGWD